MEAYNNPILSPVNKETQYSAFVQDRWAVGRLTLNMGLRFDQYHAFVDEQVKEQGTFGNSGTFPYVDVLTWRSIVPRVGMAWDLTNDGKTVLKATYGLFSHVMTEDFAQSYNQNARTTYRYRWSDPDGNNDYTPGEVNLGPQQNPAFIGVVGATNNILNADLQQPVTHEISLGVERELMRQLLGQAAVRLQASEQPVRNREHPSSLQRMEHPPRRESTRDRTGSSGNCATTAGRSPSRTTPRRLRALRLSATRR